MQTKLILFLLAILLWQSEQGFAARDCYAPWGQVVAHGTDVIAYRESRPSGGARCEYQHRRCDDGVLLGWYTHPRCEEDYSCYTPEFGHMSHYQSVTAYLNADEWNGSPCQSEVRTCIYGRLSGSYRHRSCREHGR